MWSWSNFTWQNFTVAAGTLIRWRIYYKDIYGNVNATSVHSFTVGAVIHDITVTNITLSKLNPLVNETDFIYVTLENRGNETETFELGVNYTRVFDPFIGTQNVTLEPGASVTLSFSWIPEESGRYEIKAYTSIIIGDVTPEDNTKTICIYVMSSTKNDTQHSVFKCIYLI